MMSICHLQGTSISETSSYPAFCQSAADNDTIFSSFKRDPSYQQILEHVDYNQGREYLDFIVKEYPDLIPYFDAFRENDLLGNPITYSYEEYGFFSPTTLRYIKTLGDLKAKFGDLSRLRIVEIGGGYGGLCKVISVLGFAHYTLIDLPEAISLSRKYLEMNGVSNVDFYNSTDSSFDGPYDLVISNYAFSEIDKNEQRKYIQSIFGSTPNGYLTMNFISDSFNLQSLSMEEIIAILLRMKKNGKVEKERPLSAPNNLLLTWKKTAEAPAQSQPPYPLYNSSNKSNAVSYDLSRGRFGDNLIAYFHGKWIAYKYKLPFIYAPFPFSDCFAMDDRDTNINLCNFSRQIIMANENVDVRKIADFTNDAALVIIPYSPECPLDYANLTPGWLPFIKVDWDDPIFRKELVQCMKPKKSLKALKVQNRKKAITLGVHVRRGGGWDHYESARWAWPLKFPPDSYYIEQIKKVAEIFKDSKILIYLFTDDLNPKAIAEAYADSL